VLVCDQVADLGECGQPGRERGEVLMDNRFVTGTVLTVDGGAVLL
jgi:hypothetical protein